MIDAIVMIGWHALLFAFILAFATACACGVAAVIAAITTGYRMIRDARKRRRQ